MAALQENVFNNEMLLSILPKFVSLNQDNIFRGELAFLTDHLKFYHWNFQSLSKQKVIIIFSIKVVRKKNENFDH